MKKGKKIISGIILSITLLGTGFLSSSKAYNEIEIDKFNQISTLHQELSKMYKLTYKSEHSSYCKKQSQYNYAMSLLASAKSYYYQGGCYPYFNEEEAYKKHKKAENLAYEASKIFSDIGNQEEANDSEILALSSSAESFFILAEKNKSLQNLNIAVNKLKTAANKSKTEYDRALYTAKSKEIRAIYLYPNLVAKSPMGQWEEILKLLKDAEKLYKTIGDNPSIEFCNKWANRVENEIKLIKKEKIHKK